MCVRAHTPVCVRARVCARAHASVSTPVCARARVRARPGGAGWATREHPHVVAGWQLASTRRPRPPRVCPGPRLMQEPFAQPHDGCMCPPVSTQPQICVHGYCNACITEASHTGSHTDGISKFRYLCRRDGTHTGHHVGGVIGCQSVMSVGNLFCYQCGLSCWQQHMQPCWSP